MSSYERSSPERVGASLSEMPELLPVIDQDIAERVQDLLDTRPDWPCRKGCDHCCRSLAEPLRLTRAEWQRLEAGLAKLDESVSQQIETRLQAAAQRSERPHICPFLERTSGACRVYDHRPAACRAYGFYRARSGGRFCDLVQSMIDRDGEEGLIWGNHDALEQRLERAHGETIPLTTWLAARRLAERADSQP